MVSKSSTLRSRTDIEKAELCSKFYALMSDRFETLEWIPVIDSTFAADQELALAKLESGNTMGKITVRWFSE